MNIDDLFDNSDNETKTEESTDTKVDYGMNTEEVGSAKIIDSVGTNLESGRCLIKEKSCTV